MNCFFISVVSCFTIYLIIICLQFYILFNPKIVNINDKINIENNDLIISYWNDNTIYDAYIYFTTSSHLKHSIEPKLRINDIKQNDVLNFDNINVKVPKSSKNKNSAWVHILIGKAHKNTKMMQEIVSHLKLSLVTYKESENKSENAYHMLQKLNIQIVNQHYNYSFTTIDEDLKGILPIHKRNEINYYLPLIMISEEMWSTKYDYIKLNQTTESINMNITFDSCTIGWYRITSQMKLAMKMFSNMMIIDKNELDDLKYAIINTNPKLMFLTLIVSLLHSLFDILAFRSDINYWRSRKNFGGISRRTILMSTICRVIITLYLFDQDANMLVLISNIISTIISIWKILKIFHLNIFKYIFSSNKNDENLDANNLEHKKISEVKLNEISDGKFSKLEIETKKYDDEITNIISMTLLPILLASVLYSYYVYGINHNSVYSWFLESFARAMYMFGFFLMLPQLYVNYKLKSVAHLNWSRLIYSALNTFIDDLFAFIIVMPDLHFWSVFRDDVIFFIFLFQRCIYRNRRVYTKTGIKEE